jgi:hypothetical protein
MRKWLAPIAFLVGLTVPAALFAQGFPQTFPPNTFMGRTGVTAGPGQPIPLSALTSLLGLTGLTTVGDANFSIPATARTVASTVSFSAVRTWTLPAANAVTAGTSILVADFAGAINGANTLTVQRAGSDTINGASNISLAVQYAGHWFVSDGSSKWSSQPSGLAVVSSFNARLGAVVPAAHDYTGAQVDHTFPGGGALSSVGTILNRTLWVNDYGAVCNGSTDDHAAFQAAINEGQTLGVPVRFHGNCKITTQITFTASVDFGGDNPATSIITAPSGMSALLVNTQSPVFLHDFGILYASAAANDTALTVTATTENGNSRFSNLEITGPNIGINFIRASTWILRDSLINAITTNGIGLLIQNTNNADHGDNTAYGNYIGCAGATSCVAAVSYVGAGGLRFTNNKTNGSSGASTGWSAGFQLALTAGAVTGDLWITGNSFEGLSSSGSSIALSRGAAATFQLVHIANNEFGGGQVCVNEAVDGVGQWLTAVTIQNNTCFVLNSGSAIGYYFPTSVSGLNITGGVTWAIGAGTNTNISLGTQTATNCAVGPIVKVGTFGANTLSSCTSISPN